MAEVAGLVGPTQQRGAPTSENEDAVERIPTCW